MAIAIFSLKKEEEEKKNIDLPVCKTSGAWPISLHFSENMIHL